MKHELHFCPTGDHHLHLEEVLRHLQHGGVLDEHDLHGPLHPPHLPRLLAPGQEGETNSNILVMFIRTRPAFENILVE